MKYIKIQSKIFQKQKNRKASAVTNRVIMHIDFKDFGNNTATIKEQKLSKAIPVGLITI
jgi:hypothetical protein